MSDKVAKQTLVLDRTGGSKSTEKPRARRHVYHADAPDLPRSEDDSGRSNTAYGFDVAWAAQTMGWQCDDAELIGAATKAPERRQ